MRDHQVNLYDAHEAIQRDRVRGITPNGKVFDADDAYRMGLISLAEKDASIEAYEIGGRPVWEEG